MDGCSDFSELGGENFRNILSISNSRFFGSLSCSPAKAASFSVSTGLENDPDPKLEPLYQMFLSTLPNAKVPRCCYIQKCSVLFVTFKMCSHTKFNECTVSVHK